MDKVPSISAAVTRPQSDLLAQLEALREGQRFWFWLSPRHSDDCPLMLTPIGADPDQSRLAAAARLLPLRAGNQPIISFGSVTGGQLHLAAQGLCASHLALVAAWVRSRIEEAPRFALLRGLVLHRLDGDNKIAETFADDALWEGIAPVPMKGSAAWTAKQLQSMSVGAAAWFWVTAGEHPLVLASFLQFDPEGQVLNEDIKAEIRRRGAAPRRTVRGLLRQGAGGRLQLVVPPEQFKRARRAFEVVAEAFPGIGFEQVELEPPGEGVDFSEQIKLLASLEDEATLHFWFTTDPKVGGPSLLIAEDEDRLKETVVQGNLRTRRSTRGLMRRNPRGFPELRAERPLDDFLPSLADWWRDNRALEPGLDRLRGARVTVRPPGGSGAPTKLRDDALWTL